MDNPTKQTCQVTSLKADWVTIEAVDPKSAVCQYVSQVLHIKVSTIYDFFYEGLKIKEGKVYDCWTAEMGQPGPNGPMRFNILVRLFSDLQPDQPVESPFGRMRDVKPRKNDIDFVVPMTFNLRHQINWREASPMSAQLQVTESFPRAKP